MLSKRLRSGRVDDLLRFFLVGHDLVGRYLRFWVYIDPFPCEGLDNAPF